jgi:hypothetical protein
VAGISVAAALLVIAICLGSLSVVSAVDGVRDRAADTGEARRQRNAACLDLERRLNRLIPPGATAGGQARAAAVRDENSAVRIYVDELDSERDQDAWRRLLDARTTYADALDRQAATRMTSFFVAPRAANGKTIADQLDRWSPEACAGPIRRLSAPDL